MLRRDLFKWLGGGLAIIALPAFVLLKTKRIPAGKWIVIHDSHVYYVRNIATLKIPSTATVKTWKGYAKPGRAYPVIKRLENHAFLSIDELGPARPYPYD